MDVNPRTLLASSLCDGPTESSSTIPKAASSVVPVAIGRRQALTRTLLGSLLFLSGLACSTPPGEVQPNPLPSHPHPIILVDIDTLSAGHLSTYGYPRETSPNLDAFAKEAIRFEWAFSQAPNTPPSQTSILTGLYPSTHGMIADTDRVPQDATTLAEALKAQGFATAAFVDGGYMAAGFGHDQGFDSYVSYQDNGVEKIGPEVDKWLEEHANETFFLLIHTYDVHWPYEPPEPYRSMFLDGLDPPSEGFEPTAQALENLRRSKPKKLPDNDLEHIKALYDGEIRYVDHWFGQLMERLGELDLLQRATIVVLSDHGEEFQEHGSVGHDRLYSTVTRIPLLIRLPGGSVTRTITPVVEGIDVMPTLLELAGATVPPGLQGQSMLPLIREEQHGAQVAISESPFFGDRRAIATGDHRLLWTKKNDQVEIYRFREDPLEQTDLKSTDLEAVARLRQGIEGWQRMVDQATIIKETAENEIDEETRKELRALGYLE